MFPGVPFPGPERERDAKSSRGTVRPRFWPRFERGCSKKPLHRDSGTDHLVAVDTQPVSTSMFLWTST